MSSRRESPIWETPEQFTTPGRSPNRIQKPQLNVRNLRRRLEGVAITRKNERRAAITRKKKRHSSPRHATQEAKTSSPKKGSRPASPKAAAQAASKQEAKTSSPKKGSRPASPTAAAQAASTASPQEAAREAPDGTSVAIQLVSDPEFLGCIFESIQHAANQCNSAFFRPQDLTMIGGSVLTMYNHLLEGYRARRHIPELVNFFERGTTDMDLTWWMTNSPFVPMSNRNAVFDIGEELLERLKEVFRNEHRLQAIVGRIMQSDAHVSIEDINHYKPTHFTTMRTFVDRFGSYSIKIKIRINQTIIDICELTIHDGHSSQQLNDLHQPQTPHLFGSITDPTYCTSGQAPLLPNTMMISNVRVPIITQYINQQLFSCINLLLRDNDKGYLCLKRITYLIRLLSDPLQHDENAVNIRRMLMGRFPLYQIIESFISKLMQKLQILYSRVDKSNCDNMHNRLDAALRPIGPTMRIYFKRIGVFDYIMSCRNPGASVAAVPLASEPLASEPLAAEPFERAVPLAAPLAVPLAAEPALSRRARRKLDEKKKGGTRKR